MRKQSVDIGTALNIAFRAIEDANPRLRGVFQDVDFANKERFPDALLDALLQHFETYRMRKADVDSRVLGDAYEYLIAKFAEDLRSPIPALAVIRENIKAGVNKGWGEENASAFIKQLEDAAGVQVTA